MLKWQKILKNGIFSQNRILCPISIQIGKTFCDTGFFTVSLRIQTQLSLHLEDKL